MASPNIWLRDPLLYRIRHTAHHHTGDEVVHLPDVRLRPLPERLHRGHHPQHLHPRVRGPPSALRLDPREPRPPAAAAAPVRIRQAESRLHRREQAQADPAREREDRHRLGRPAHAHHLAAFAVAACPRAPLRGFAIGVGVTKFNSLTDMAVLEHAIREELNKRALRRLAVLRPLKVVLTNLPRGARRGAATRSTIPKTRPPARASSALTRELYIEHDDFMESRRRSFSA